MRYVTIYAKDIHIVPEFFKELESRTRSKVIKQYINNVIKKHFLFDNKQEIENSKNEKAKKSFEANEIKSVVADLIRAKNKIQEQKFLRENDLISYKMFPTNIFENVLPTVVKQAKLNLKKYLKNNKIVFNSTRIEKINKTLQKDKFLRRFIKDKYSNEELLTAFIIYKFKILNVIDLNQDSIFTYNFSEEEKEHLKHIIDYLNSKLDVENTPNWKEEKAQKEKELKEHLSNLSFEDLTQEVTNYNFTDTDITAKSLQDEIKDKDVTLIHTYPNKYSWVSIISKEGLEREGSNMNHCVGGHEYWENVKNGDTVIYSLRDKYNKPHITIEVTSTSIMQIQGYGNSTVNDKYHDMLLDGLQNHIEFIRPDRYYFNKNGIIQQNNMLYSVYDLPDNFEDDEIIIPETNRKFTIKNLKCSNLEIKNCPNISITGKIVTKTLKIENEKFFFTLYKFLKNIDYITGYIKKYYVNVHKESDLYNLKECVPDKIKDLLKDNRINVKTYSIKSISMTKVKGDLYLYGTTITKLPEKLHVGGDLNLRSTKITELPEKLHVNGNLNLQNTKITELPKDLHVGGDLCISDTNISELPKDLHVGGTLDLSYTRILNLPEGLRINGHLDISHTDITKLPEKLYICGSLYLSDTPITELPKDLHVGGHLDISDTNITYLPKDLHVGGGLDLYGTKITELPKGLHVNGNLNLQNTNITELPKDLHVVGNLYLYGTQIKDLPKDLHVGGSIVRKCTYFTDDDDG